MRKRPARIPTAYGQKPSLGQQRDTSHLTKNRRQALPADRRDMKSSSPPNQTDRQKKKPATKRCGLESNFLRRLEETGATIAMRPRRVCFIVAIADIHSSHICRTNGATCGFLAPHPTGTSPCTLEVTGLGGTFPLRSQACSNSNAETSKTSAFVLITTSLNEYSCKECHLPPALPACQADQAALRRPLIAPVAGGIRAAARFFS